MRVFWPTRPYCELFTRQATVKFENAVTKFLKQISLRNTYPIHVLPRLNQQPKDRLNRHQRFYYSAIPRLMALPFETSPNSWGFRSQLSYYYSMGTFDVCSMYPELFFKIQSDRFVSFIAQSRSFLPKNITSSRFFFLILIYFLRTPCGLRFRVFRFAV